ncbi:MAG: DUF4974 domain-containing protein [Odoribacteraceae bacterium]|jgi:ferric-dicitrate binding protein FerR (iron transport regulator)|nr:DUF4974 domain-containing protein [Odoribacteraceae bacterium]
MDDLIIKVLDGEATPEEIRELARWMQEEVREAYFYRLKKAWHLTNGLLPGPGREEEELKRYLAYIRSRTVRRSRVLVWSRRASVIALLLSAVAFAYYSSRQGGRLADDLVEEVILRPGGPRATLFRGDREVIALGDHRGAVVRRDSVIPSPGAGGVSVLPVAGAGDEGERWFRLVTPRGGEYQLTLPDGTCAYLNSETTVEFPPVFGDDCREVRLTGEAYFEVAAESARPFIVVAGRCNIRVHGTSFNVNAYAGARSRTVLVTGKISVSGADGQEHALLPSRLVEFDADGRFVETREVDAYAHTAWRSGYFAFENENLESVLSILSRWYDAEVLYIDDSVKKYHFTGSVERYENIHAILDAISKMVDVKFSVRDATIIVSK